MISVEQTLRERRSNSKGSLVGYFPAGYPTVQDSTDALIALANGGCSVLEIGIPYSDPVMDGPVIQKATETALDNGFRIADVFTIIRSIRAVSDVPILVMSYWNPILAYGVREFSKNLAASGGQGMITPDLIPDEASDWITISDEFSLERVFLSAPSSNEGRVASAVSNSRGFVYAVSTMGITGERAQLDSLARKVVERIRSAGDRPACVGVGISTAEQVREVNSYADGAIVGTAFIKAYEDGGLAALRSKVSELAVGLD
ncbi:MAG: tryptophan synthase subunit alpha [Aquiluna sp.]